MQRNRSRKWKVVLALGFAGLLAAGLVAFIPAVASADEAEAHAKDILELEINGHMPVGVLVRYRKGSPAVGRSPAHGVQGNGRAFPALPSFPSFAAAAVGQLR